MKTEPDRRFGTLLRTWRKLRQASQASVAKRTGISVRHLSFLENGRAKPSRDMVGWLVGALEIPARDHATLLEAAGFSGAETAPVAPSAAATEALNDIVDAYGEHPALCHDVYGTVLAMNLACRELLSTAVGPLERFEGPGGGHLLVAALAPHVGNWEGLVEMYLRRLTDEMLMGQADLQATYERWTTLVKPELLARAKDRRVEPALSVQLTLEEQRFKAFTASLGTHRYSGLGIVRLLGLIRTP